MLYTLTLAQCKERELVIYFMTSVTQIIWCKIVWWLVNWKGFGTERLWHNWGTVWNWAVKAQLRYSLELRGHGAVELQFGTERSWHNWGIILTFMLKGWEKGRTPTNISCPDGDANQASLEHKSSALPHHCCVPVLLLITVEHNRCIVVLPREGAERM
jgi:hypothetical protein